jgi:hypothetical protein
MKVSNTIIKIKSKNHKTLKGFEYEEKQKNNNRKVKINRRKLRDNKRNWGEV